MTPKDLPELPKPEGVFWTDHGYGREPIPRATFQYPADQMHAYGRKCYELGARSTAAQPVEPTGLRSAALAMVAKMDVLKPHMDALCLDSHNRGRPYKGPTYGIELEALRAAASGDSTPPSEPADVPEVVRKLRDALRRLLDSDPTGSIATATDAELRSAVDDDAADPVVREQAAAVLQGRMALSSVQGDPSGALRPEPEAVGQDGSEAQCSRSGG